MVKLSLMGLDGCKSRKVWIGGEVKSDRFGWVVKV